MKKILFSAIALAVSLAGYAQWKPAGDKIKTTWAEQIDPNNVLPEYPRPIMERKEWKNLNGLWEYAIRPTGTQQPADMDGQILVPFAVESSLSGVMKTLGKENELWYSREFTVPSSWKGKNILLHFGAVDWQADVWVNGVKMGQHRGGYTPFSFDITPVLAKGKNQITVKVWDPSDEGYQPRGKQVKHPDGIWYTPVSGIWQTVWMEPVSANHITRLKTTPDIDKKILIVSGERRGESSGRSKYNEMEIHRSNATAKAHRLVHQWRAVIDYSERDVWEVIKRNRTTPHPCYSAGWNRCSCMMCIFSLPRHWAGIRELFPEEFEAVKNDEERLGFTLDNKKDLEEYVGDAESCVCHAAVEAIRQIISGKFTVDEITTPSELWDFPAGAFKGSDGGPC